MIQSDIVVKRESVDSYLKFLKNLKLEFPENKSELEKIINIVGDIQSKKSLDFKDESLVLGFFINKNIAYPKFIIHAPQRTTTHAAKLEFLAITPYSCALSAIGAALANPTFKSDDNNQQVTAIKIPFTILLDLLSLLKSLSLSIPAFAVIATPINEINKPPII